MYLKLLPVFLVIFFSSLYCEAQSSVIVIPMKKGKVSYDTSYILNAGLQKKELFNRCLKWFKDTSENIKKAIRSSDEKSGEIIGNGLFKIITSNTGNYYWIRFIIDIKVHNEGYEFNAHSFYEKPIESGISNEYSKIEYRWWDYRQGKPWSAEDETLFKGIAANETSSMAALLQQMSDKR
jgi:Domain of unknown function (DUF4468) with TBP-like fold